MADDSTQPEQEQGIRAEDASILAWVLKNKLKSEKQQELAFHDRLFLLDILTDWNREIVWKKCSQVGGSVIFNLKCFFALAKFGWSIIYTMPTDGDVEDFVKTKTNPLLKANPDVFKGVSQDSIYLKEINKRFLHFKGTVSKTAAISTTADLLVHDEASRSDQKAMGVYKSRTKASKYKGRWLFSNPTTEKDILDEKWKVSDQKEWVILCGGPENKLEGCGMEQILRWPESIDPERKCFQCVDCKREITTEERRVGKWVPQNPGAKVSGYHTSHLMAPWITAEEILEESDGDLEYFYNFVLGEPYNPGDLSVSRATILDLWTPKELTTKSYYLGVDVGNIKYYVLGSEKGILKVGRFTKWSELDDMMKMYNPTLVIDANPDNTMARYYVDTYQGAYMSFFKENTENPKVIVWWGKGEGENDRKGIVYSNRNRILDQLINDMLNAKFLIGVASDAELKRYVKHWETLRRVKVVNTKGIESYEWDSTTGEDHYVFATLYYRLAVLSYGAGVVIPESGPDDYDFLKNGTVGDWGDMFDQAQGHDN